MSKPKSTVIQEAATRQLHTVSTRLKAAEQRAQAAHDQWQAASSEVNVLRKEQADLMDALGRKRSKPIRLSAQS